MAERAVDLSVEELAALGATAARLAVESARRAGLTITGTFDSYHEDQAVSSLAQLHPSGTVTLVREGEASADEALPAARRDRGKAAD